jgi:cation diffusion facilitator CzcD-associated flavoprotein CzcO
MSTHHEVVIIGAGISGIAAAIMLKQAGVEDVLILEKTNGYGGTWRANTYPGCACDVPSGLYSYSFAPNPRWSRVYGTQPEILAYIDGVARDHGLVPLTQFGTEVTEARWDRDMRLWHIRTPAGTYSARFLVAAAGPWDEPKIPAIPGLDSFDGEIFHSARWDHDYDLTGKRVAVIGSGASAVQFVPHLQHRVAQLHLFQRTAHWVLPKPDRRVGAAAMWALEHFAAARRAQRAGEHALMETIGAAFHHPRPLMQLLQAIARRHLRRSVPDPQLRATLTPRYLLGCKRILFSNNYLQSLTRDNVVVHAAAVDAVQGSTIVGSDGSRCEADALILGTGFHILDMPVANLIHGADGHSLAQRWAGSPEAYLGTCVAGFPNAFLILGPSLGSGHTSAFTVAETQVALIVEAITAARRQGWTSLDARPEAMAAYVDAVQAALPGTAYNAATCNSYYLDANGRNSFSWPWSTRELITRVGTFRPEHFDTTADTRTEVPT